MIHKRSMGVLLHPTSLPTMWGVGDLGPIAYEFVDELEGAGQTIWQVLPLNQVAGHGSPYSPHSLFAGNPLLLSPDKLLEDGHMERIPQAPHSDPREVDYDSALAFKRSIVDQAYHSSYGRTKKQSDFDEFRSDNANWLDDYALYDAIRDHLNEPWYLWPRSLRDRDPTALEEMRSKLRDSIERTIFAQYLFSSQWSSLTRYARSKGVRILGDVPFYVLHDSVDIWAHRELFKVSDAGLPVYVGGVPPDYFSATGQRWGNPVYDWEVLEKSDYGWWNDRISRNLQLADLLRLDHFRGYVAYWEIPSEDKTAEGGRWVEVPDSFLPTLMSNFPDLPFIAEDLGVITQDVKDAIQTLGIPGMEVLQFAFDGDPDNPYVPSRHKKNSLVCTGTHDTNTTLGWFQDEATPHEKKVLQDCLGRQVTPENVCELLVSVAADSIADLCVIPMQDVLGLGSEARMNNPSTSVGNWRWRALPGEISGSSFEKIGEMARSSGRC